MNNRLRFYFNQTKSFTVDELVAAYDLCRHLYVTFNIKRDNILWCKLFSKADLDVFEFYEELNILNGVFHNSTDLASNVCGIVESMESTLNTEDGLIGVSFFTNTQQFLPFLRSLKFLTPTHAEDFEKRALIPWRVKEIAGRMSTLTVYKYG